MLIERIAELRKQAVLAKTELDGSQPERFVLTPNELLDMLDAYVLAKTGIDGSQPERFVLTPNELLDMLDAYVKVHGPGR
jgi:hypothetical protein